MIATAETSLPKKVIQTENKHVFSEIGIALTPKDYPKQTNKDIEEMFAKGKNIGNYAVFIYQWSDPFFLKIAKKMVELCGKYKLNPILALSPTVMNGFRDKLDIPEAIRKNTKKNLSFSNSKIYQAYIETVVELAKMKPPYLCLATEINLLAFKNSKEYIYFAKVYKELYPVIKKISPQTKVFVSFQWDYMRILDIKEPNKLAAHKKLIDIFRPELDVVAFTTYPNDHYNTVSKIPDDYYSKIYDHITRKDEVMFMEIGWPGTNDNSNLEQMRFVNELPRLMKEVTPKIIIWSLLHDVNSSILSADLANTGLIEKDGTIKPVYKSFIELKKK